VIHRLVAISWALKDSVLHYPPEDFRSGGMRQRPAHSPIPRSPADTVCLPSRRGRFQDPGPRQPQRHVVNGHALKESWLRHHDEISAATPHSCSHRKRYRQARRSQSPRRIRDEKPTHATAEIRPQDVLYLQPDRILSELPATSVSLESECASKIRSCPTFHPRSRRITGHLLHLIFEVAPRTRRHSSRRHQTDASSTRLRSQPGRDERALSARQPHHRATRSGGRGRLS